jgi:hypothetical protein
MYRPSRSSNDASTRQLATALETHHLLDDGFALFGHVLLFARQVRAVFAQLATLAAGFHGD